VGLDGYSRVLLHPANPFNFRRAKHGDEQNPRKIVEIEVVHWVWMGIQ